ncbi:MAG: ATP-binding protein [Nevskia sp.]|nr:ATP-binding protein [Nevskia sp.]
MTTPTLLAWSGGKDCLLALNALLHDPQWQVCALLTTVTQRYQRVAMHGVRRDVLLAQAAALGLPLIEAVLEEPGDNAAYERAQHAALAQAAERFPGLRHCAFGDLFLEDVRAYRQAQLARWGWHGVYPLWNTDTAALARQFIDQGHRAVVVCVDTTQLAAEFCGREFDSAFLDALPPGVDPCGERGEFHTLAYGGPLFRAPLPLTRDQSVLRDGRFQYTEFVLAQGA